MKILHINTYQTGGAALCSMRICRALSQAGIESKMLFAEGVTMPEGIDGDVAEGDNSFIDSVDILRKIKRLPTLLPFVWDEKKMRFAIKRANIQQTFVTSPLSKFKNISHHPLVEWADIIHLHWVAEFVDYPTFFSKVNKPIVWTLHDMNPALGLMHFESDHTVRPKELDETDAICRKIKRRSLLKSKNLHIVAISDMMKENILSSYVLKGYPTTLIHNGVETNVFKPHTKHNSKALEYIERLDKDTKVFLFNAYNIWEKRKGLDRVISALERVKNNCKISLVIIGNNFEQGREPKATFPIYCTGYISKQEELAQLYSDADFYINVSYEEAFSQTILEAMACGLPVISTPCSGASDLIRPFNGVICNGYDCDALVEGITNASKMQYNQDAIRNNIIENYNYNKITREYINLYFCILESSFQ